MFSLRETPAPPRLILAVAHRYRVDDALPVMQDRARVIHPRVAQEAQAGDVSLVALRQLVQIGHRHHCRLQILSRHLGGISPRAARAPWSRRPGGHLPARPARGSSVGAPPAGRALLPGVMMHSPLHEKTKRGRTARSRCVEVIDAGGEILDTIRDRDRIGRERESQHRFGSTTVQLVL